MGTPPTIQLANLGMADSLILMVLALVVFGPRRLPQIGRQIGKLMYEFRKASNDFKFQMEEELRNAEDADRRKKEEEQRKQLALSQPAQESVSATPAVAEAIEAPPYPATPSSPYPSSPYPGEGQYPETVTAPIAEDTAPRILPPATGEPVAATLRSPSAELTEPPAEGEGKVEEAAPTPGGTAAGAESRENAPATEAVSHNG